MRIRPAQPADAPAMGRVMVQAWLHAHRGQLPDHLWRKRVQEWTPEVSAAAWARLLGDQESTEARVVLLLAEDNDAGADPLGLVLAGQDEEGPAGSAAEVAALYVRPDRLNQGIGRALLREAARELIGLGFSTLHISVLAANRPARGFYEAMGGHEVGERTLDEEGVPLLGIVYAWPDVTELLDGHGLR